MCEFWQTQTHSRVNPNIVSETPIITVLFVPRSLIFQLTPISLTLWWLFYKQVHMLPRWLSGQPVHMSTAASANNGEQSVRRGPDPWSPRLHPCAASDQTPGALSALRPLPSVHQLARHPAGQWSKGGGWVSIYQSCFGNKLWLVQIGLQKMVNHATTLRQNLAEVVQRPSPKSLDSYEKHEP